MLEGRWLVIHPYGYLVLFPFKNKILYSYEGVKQEVTNILGEWVYCIAFSLTEEEMDTPHDFEEVVFRSRLEGRRTHP